MAHGSVHSQTGTAPVAQGQHHSLKLYFTVWFLLFVLSTFSYLVDYAEVQGYLRWFLIVIFMLLKAGLIVAVFMHLAWERLALGYAILLPPLFLLVFLVIIDIEASYISLSRLTFMDSP